MKTQLYQLRLKLNSVGELPLSFLGATNEQKAKVMLLNAKEILEMYRVKDHEKIIELLHYQPYYGLADAGNSVENCLASIQQLVREQDCNEAI